MVLVAPLAPKQEVRIGREVGYIYAKCTESLWCGCRSGEDAPLDGRTWRIFVRIESSRIVAFDVVVNEAGRPT